jgi:hypothetical protein
VSDKRLRSIAVVACLAGAALALFATSRTWTVAVHPQPPPLPPLRTARTGAALHPWLPALCLVALAGAGALLATGPRGRVAVGVLLAACGTGIAVGGGAGGGGWGWLCAAGGAVVAAAGVVAAVRGRRWPALGSRYERPAKTGSHIWDALDRGDDPTA